MNVTTAENLHHLWETPGFPHRGWECLDVVDLNPDELPAEEVEYGTCEACGQHPIRFVHVLRHDDWQDDVRVGCICSARLTEDYVTPYHRERELKNEAGRRRRQVIRAKVERAMQAARRERIRQNWGSMPWRTSSKGNAWTKPDGVLVVVFPAPGGYRYMAGGEFSTASYRDEDAAKAASLDGFERAHRREDPS
jgi:hypothetical protein